MFKLSQEWWEHLTPKPMHCRRREIESLLSRWCQTPYGKHWLHTARQEHGVIRVKTGQMIPAVHLIAIADRPIFVTPQQPIRHGHRMAGGREFRSGKPLEACELALQPTIQLDVVTDKALINAATERPIPLHVPEVKEPALLFSAPAHMLLAPKSGVHRSYVLYQHIFGDGGSYPIDGHFYVGVTIRSWQKRWSEHRRKIETGSQLLFHRRFREERAAGRITYVHHKVMGVTDDIEELYATEEYLVREHWDDARRLNMIPGGKFGLKYLREHGLLPPRIVPKPDDRDAYIAAWLKNHPRAGLPAPWVAEKWKDEAWAIAQICGRDGRLSVEQVRSIRALAKEHTAEVIADRIGALNKEQVQRVINGETYTRVT